MECPKIIGLRLDQRSREGIERIRKAQQLSDRLAVAIGAGTVTTLFAKSTAPETAYNVMDTDWRLFTQALVAIPAISRERLKQEAALQILDHAGDPKQRTFWQAVHGGCKLRP